METTEQKEATVEEQDHIIEGGTFSWEKRGMQLQ